jgi:hypothetical protein
MGPCWKPSNTSAFLRRCRAVSTPADPGKDRCGILQTYYLLHVITYRNILPPSPLLPSFQKQTSTATMNITHFPGLHSCIPSRAHVSSDLIYPVPKSLTSIVQSISRVPSKQTLEVKTPRAGGPRAKDSTWCAIVLQHTARALTSEFGRSG